MPFRTASPTGPRCPRCPDRRLVHGSVATMRVMECAGCGGVWLGLWSFRKLQRSRDLQLAVVRAVPARNLDRPDGATIACPRCGDPLVPYAYKGGPVIDQCLKLHGVWFDAGELRAAVERMVLA